MKRSRRRTAKQPIEVPFTNVSGMEPGTRKFRMGGCTILLSDSHVGWHLSISHPQRYPTWDEIAEARYKLVPDKVTMAMMLPPRDEYLNLHPNCFHLWQVDNPEQSPARRFR